MGEVRIVTDSTADLSLDIIEKYEIKVVPLKVFIGQDVFLDGVEITPGEFFRRQVEKKETSTTSQPPPGDFARVYGQLLEEGHTVISLHLSGKLSGTVQSARLAQKMLEEDSPGAALEPGRLAVIDTGMASGALGILVFNAARAAAHGMGAERILDMVRAQMQSMKVYFTLESLEYLQRGGRIGMAKAFLGTLLHVKPILTLMDGHLHPAEKIRGSKNRAVDRIVRLMEENFTSKEPLQCCLLHGEDRPGLKLLEENVLASSLNCVETFCMQLGPVVGTHTGPGVLGMVALPAKSPVGNSDI